MSESQKWYLCKRDVGITILITLVVFIMNPVDNAYKIKPVNDDMGVLGGLTITAFVLLESLLIRTQNYWKWIILSMITITAGAFINRKYPSIYTFSDVITMIVINGVLFLLFTLPAAAVVYFLKKKLTKHALNYNTLIDIPPLIIFFSIIWESFLVWIIFGI